MINKENEQDFKSLLSAAKALIEASETGRGMNSSHVKALKTALTSTLLRNEFDHEKDLLLWKGETGDWLAAHPWVDIITQAPTRELAIEAFLEAFALHALWQLNHDGSIILRLTPPDVLEDYRKKVAEQQAAQE